MTIKEAYRVVISVTAICHLELLCYHIVSHGKNLIMIRNVCHIRRYLFQLDASLITLAYLTVPCIVSLYLNFVSFWGTSPGLTPDQGLCLWNPLMLRGPQTHIIGSPFVQL